VLRDIDDPEEKPRRIGKVFIPGLRAGRGGSDRDVRFLVQGTLYPDVIDSRSVRGPSAVIKTHHNVAGCRRTCSSN
jgi:GMP synthase (glutamine-hydrolysing)